MISSPQKINDELKRKYLTQIGISPDKKLTVDHFKTLELIHQKDENRTNFKIVLLGNGGAGKTSLIHALRRSNQNFLFRDPFSITPTTLSIDVHDGKDILGVDFPSFKIWDFAGQMEYSFVHQV